MHSDRIYVFRQNICSWNLFWMMIHTVYIYIYTLKQTKKKVYSQYTEMYTQKEYSENIHDVTLFFFWGEYSIRTTSCIREYYTDTTPLKKSVFSKMILTFRVLNSVSLYCESILHVINLSALRYQVPYLTKTLPAKKCCGVRRCPGRKWYGNSWSRNIRSTS